MDEITFDDKTYVSSKRAAQITGYAKDYVGQLCREGRVEARLVGRNWYILESSIRAHRFGPEMPKEEFKNENESWESANYVSETISDLPILDSIQKPHTQETTDAAGDHSNTIQEMQNAWQDWFTKKNEQISPDIAETKTISPEIIVNQEESLQETGGEVVETAQEDPAEIVHVVKMVPTHVHELPQEPLYTVPIGSRIAYKVDQEEVAAVRRPFEMQAATPTYQPSQIEESRVESREEFLSISPSMPRRPIYGSPAYEGRIVRERRVQKKKKPSVALQALFISLAAVSIVIALIGSGQADTFLNQSHFQYAPINFLGGENILNK